MSEPVDIAVFVSGSGSNLEAVLAAAECGFAAVRVVAVVSDVPGAFGLIRAARRGVPTLAVDKRRYQSRGDHERAVLEALAPYAPRMAVLAGYMRLITPVLLEHFSSEGRLGVVNIHPADTRAYQGTHGYEFALGLTGKGAKRLDKTYITVHFVDEGMDTGAIIAQAEVPIHPDDTLDDVKARGLAVEHQLLPRMVDRVARGEVVLRDGAALEP
ncbi:MAG: phosphoribosylglycinamide formyltransferase [bacterium]